MSYSLNGSVLIKAVKTCGKSTYFLMTEKFKFLDKRWNSSLYWKNNPAAFQVRNILAILQYKIISFFNILY